MEDPQAVHTRQGVSRDVSGAERGLGSGAVRRAGQRASEPGVIVVLGGTGMLLPAVKQLLRAGETVVLVSRRASAALVALPKDAGTAADAGVTGEAGAAADAGSAADADAPGRALAVDADWAEAADYARRISAAVAGSPVRGMIVWVHHPHRDAVLRELAPLLTDRTRVVRLWGSSGGDPRTKARQAYRPARGDICEVYLGRAAAKSNRQWLTHEEISQGALTALRGAAAEYTVGELLSV